MGESGWYQQYAWTVRDIFPAGSARVAGGETSGDWGQCLYSGNYSSHELCPIGTAE